MVILDNKAMLTAGNNQYLQPDYLSPLSTTLDSKKSPLALLAQTCSQIGADSSKPLPASAEKSKKEEERKASSSSASPAPPTPSPPAPLPVRNRSPAFKPYESCHKKEEAPDERLPSVVTNGSIKEHKEDVMAGRRSSDLTASSASTTPIIRSGLEVLAGHPKDVPLGTYRPSVSPFLSQGYPGLEAHPALRGAHPGLFGQGFLPGLGLSSSYSAASAAAAAALYSSPFSYTRVKTGGGGEAVVPVCRDPFCAGCPYSVQNNHLLQSGGACPPSCAQCEQAKAALSALPGLAAVPPTSLVPASSLLPTPPTPSSLFGPLPPVSSTTSSSSSSPLLGNGAPRHHVCSWIAGDSYCGKKFASSDELLQHLRTHTSVASDAHALSLLSNPLHAHAAHASLLSSAHSLQGFHHRQAAPSYPPPSLSPLTAARYHPYSKPPHTSPLGVSAASVLSPQLPSALSHYAALSGYPPGYPYASLYPRPL